MDIGLLIAVLSRTSVSKKEIKEYMSEYVNTITMTSMAIILDTLNEQGATDELDSIVEAIRQIEKHKNSIDMGDEEKEKELWVKYIEIMKELKSLPVGEIVGQKIEEELDKLDSEIAVEIMQSCSKEEREKIMEYLRIVKDNIAEANREGKVNLNINSDDALFEVDSEILKKDTIRLIDNFSESS